MTVLLVCGACLVSGYSMTRSPRPASMLHGDQAGLLSVQFSCTCTTAELASHRSLGLQPLSRDFDVFVIGLQTLSPCLCRFWLNDTSQLQTRPAL